MASFKSTSNDGWLKPAFAQMHRVLKRDALCISFYGWSKARHLPDRVASGGLPARRSIVFRKPYASKSGFTKYHHESAYLLAKGNPAMPAEPPPDVIEWTYSGNRLHPTQKPVGIFKPLIAALTKPGDTVMDPFCGSGSTLAAARDLGPPFHRHRDGPEPPPNGLETPERLPERQQRPLDLSARFNQQQSATAAAGSSTGPMAPRSTDADKNNGIRRWKPPVSVPPPQSAPVAPGYSRRDSPQR